MPHCRYVHLSGIQSQHQSPIDIYFRWRRWKMEKRRSQTYDLDARPGAHGNSRWFLRSFLNHEFEYVVVLNSRSAEINLALQQMADLLNVVHLSIQVVIHTMHPVTMQLLSIKPCMNSCCILTRLFRWIPTIYCLSLIRILSHAESKFVRCHEKCFDSVRCLDHGQAWSICGQIFLPFDWMMSLCWEIWIFPQRWHSCMEGSKYRWTQEVPRTFFFKSIPSWFLNGSVARPSV
jgi:hypothetical protein